MVDEQGFARAVVTVTSSDQAFVIGRAGRHRWTEHADRLRRSTGLGVGKNVLRDRFAISGQRPDIQRSRRGMQRALGRRMRRLLSASQSLALNRIELNPPFDSSLSAEISVPPEFVRADGRHADLCRMGFPAPLCVMESSSLEAVVVATASSMPFEVDVEDWCRFRCTSSGWHVVRAASVVLAHGDLGHELISQCSGGMLRRDVAIAIGGTLLQVHVLVDQVAWASSRLLWEALGNSLRVSKRLLDGTVEQRSAVALAGTPLAFELPASWSARVRQAGDRECIVDAEAAGSEGPIWLRLRAAPSRTAASAACRRAVFESALLERGFALHGHPEPDRPRRELGIDRVWREGWVLDAIGPASVAYEVRFWHVDAFGHTFDAMLVVGWHSERRLDWMRGVRALEVAVSTVDDRGGR